MTTTAAPANATNDSIVAGRSVATAIETPESKRADPPHRSSVDAARGTGPASEAAVVQQEVPPVQLSAAAGPASGSKQPVAGPSSGASESLPVVGWIAVVAFYILAGLGIAAIWNDRARNFWVNYWLWVLIGIGVIAALRGLANRLKMSAKAGLLNRLKMSAKDVRKALSYIVIPTITGAMMSLILFPWIDLTIAAQLIMILITALLPAIAYFLFLATRRPSILNEFIANLVRLGLLVRRGAFSKDVQNQSAGESDGARRVRVESYFQRFEAMYGTLRLQGQDRTLKRRELVDELIAATEDPSSGHRIPEATASVGDFFHAHLIVPTGLVTILTTLGWLLVLQPHFSRTPDSYIANMIPKATPVNFAFLGAYFFGIQMLFRRFVRRDLGPNAYFAFANRIILAVIGAWLVTIAVPDLWSATNHRAGANVDSPILLLAFAVGVFPRIIWQLVSAGAAKVVRLVLPKFDAKLPLNELDGLTVWHEARLEEEDVENVPNLASVDVVELMLHTQIPVERLVDWIDQAILVTALGSTTDNPNSLKTRHLLRNLGLRTASQVVAVAAAETSSSSALTTALGKPQLDALVIGLKKEANFSLVSVWQQV